MGYNRLKWYTVIFPVVGIALVEFLQFMLVEPLWGVAYADAFGLVFLLGGAYLFSRFVFRTVDRIDAELHRNEERVQALFSSSSDAIVVLGGDGVVRALNPAAQRLLGWSAEEANGKRRCTELCGCEGPCRGMEVARTRRAVPYVEMKLASRRGRELAVTASYSPLPTRHGEVQVAVIMRDITEKKRLEEEVGRRRREVEALYLTGQELSALDNLAEGIPAVVTKLRELSGGDVVGCAALDERWRRMRWEALQGQREETTLRHCWSADEGLTAQVLTRGTPLTGDAGEALPGEAVESALAVPIRARERVFGFLLVGYRQPHSFGGEEIRLLTGVATQAGVAMNNAELYQQVQEMAVLEERERLARELHDGLAQSLSYLNLKLQTVEAQLDEGKIRQAQREMAQMQKVVEDSYADVRQGIFALKTRISSPGFLNTLADYLREYQGSCGIATELQLEPADLELKLPQSAEIQLLRIVQEALPNVRKHAGATRVEVQVRRLEQTVSCVVSDNGQGFEPERPIDDANHHYGLSVMSERAELLGGHLEIASRPGAGTRLTVWLPYHDEGVVNLPGGTGQSVAV